MNILLVPARSAYINEGVKDAFFKSSLIYFTPATTIAAKVDALQIKTSDKTYIYFNGIKIATHRTMEMGRNRELDNMQIFFCTNEFEFDVFSLSLSQSPFAASRST